MAFIRETIRKKKIDIVFIIFLLSVLIWIFMYSVVDISRERLILLTTIIIPVVSIIFLVKSIITRKNIDSFGLSIFMITMLIKNDIEYAVSQDANISPIFIGISNVLIKYLLPALFLIGMLIFIRKKGLRNLTPKDGMLFVNAFLYVLLLVVIFTS